MSNPDIFHQLAKDAGNKLKSYVLSFSSAASGLYFLALTQPSIGDLSSIEKSLLLYAFIGFVVTVVVCLIELRVDAKRFYHVAKQLNIPEEDQDWKTNEHYKIIRLVLIYTSYVTCFMALLLTVIYMALRLL